jgi:hypothetical protein
MLIAHQKKNIGTRGFHDRRSDLAIRARKTAGEKHASSLPLEGEGVKREWQAKAARPSLFFVQSDSTMHRFFQIGLVFFVGAGGILVSAKEAAPDLLPWVPSSSYTTCPQTILSNQALTLRVMHPDPEKGFYRGGRFEWSGIIAEAFSPKHRYIGQAPDAKTGEPHLSLGTASEFKPPFAVPAEKAGEASHQIRIGQGVYVENEKASPEEKPTYRLEKAVPWQVEIKEKEKTIVSRQEFTHPSGYGYEYRKELILDSVLPVVTVIYRLKNTGTRPMEMTHYCHNWFCLDGASTAYELTFPYKIESVVKVHAKENGAQVEGGRITFDPAVGYKRVYWLSMHPVEGVANNTFTLRNVLTGALIRHTGDWMPSSVNVYATDDTFCPEPHYPMLVQPGETRTWTSRYEFLEEATP